MFEQIFANTMQCQLDLKNAAKKLFGFDLDFSSKITIKSDHFTNSKFFEDQIHFFYLI